MGLTFRFVSIGLFTTFLLSGCGRVPSYLGAEDRDNSLTKAVPRRLHLLQFVSQGYAPIKDKASSLDVGVMETTEESGVRCELMAPRTDSRVAKQPWAPSDLYTNVLTEEEKQTEVKRAGEKDIYFEGDDKNRNNKQETYDWTLAPDTKLTNSMDFGNKTQTPSEVSFYLQFTRTGISYETLLKISTIPSATGCAAYAYVCDSQALDKETRSCKTGGWRRFSRAIVDVDVKGALMDSLKPPPSDKQRNDIKALRFSLSKVDEKGIPVGDIYEETVAKK